MIDPSLLKAGFDALGGVEGISKGIKAAKNLMKKDAPQAESMKYSPELESFIAMITEDGKISEKEIELLRKRAEKAGEDPDEVEYVVMKRLSSRPVETPAQKLTKAKANPLAYHNALSTLTAPEDDEQLLEVVAFLFHEKDSSFGDLVKTAHARLYDVAERRLKSNPELLKELKKYKIKKFGFF